MSACLLLSLSLGLLAAEPAAATSTSSSAASATLPAGTSPATPAKLAERRYQQQGWWIVETTNFRVCTLENFDESTRIARHCEALRKSIRDLWLPGTAEAVWTPRCDVIAHATDAGYLRAVGRGAAHTAGSALIEFEATQVAVRRVDLKHASPEALESALAHELTHVVLADRFSEQQIPRWADEGMAVLADSQAKQRLHWRDLHRGLQSHTTLRLAEMVGLEDYPAPDRMAVFYGQSVSLVSFLLEYGKPGQFVEFVEASLKSGYDQALRDVYQLKGLADLEQRWLSSISTAGTTRFVSSTPADFPVINSLAAQRRGT